VTGLTRQHRAQLAEPVDPPHGAWCDDARAVADAMAILKLPAGDPAEEQLEVAAASACEKITAFLDRDDDDPIVGDPSALRTAHAQVTIELYRRKDAPFGVLNAWSADEVPLRISNDPLRGVHKLLLPYKSGWGVG
jgi:hypothetical protein